MRTRGFDLSRRMVKTFGWRCGVFLGKRGFVGLAAFFSRNEQETKQNEKEEKPKRSAAAGDDGRGGGAVSYGGCGCDFKKRAFRRVASGKHLVAECLHPDAHSSASGVHGVFVRRDAVDFRRGDAERSAQSAGVELHAGRVLRRVAGRSGGVGAGDHLPRPALWRHRRDSDRLRVSVTSDNSGACLCP